MFVPFFASVYGRMQLSSVLALFFLVFLGLACTVSSGEAKKKEENKVIVEEAKLEYAKGSLCGYCDYCKFCTLCDKDCPCETSKSKPNCHMCKYCKFCYLCKVCDAVCTPGGYLDTVSAAIVNALPSYNKEEVDGDIDSVKDWIEKKKDEL